mmetsp:Transcript_19589/g.29054  ORF Transcript_19589/g.29054 Transcript_19589/m.29054 type:complete len:221 (-) Transcript_19589:99-761(-)|eukprot:CAMPEP_0194211012 /NCGR_PEP_ID=MMETSP0156-20130528/9234_1 /TAXON_ID=33649 /ORGANISM="Thalassionema nitzschioides, Strain L26-B" /LENGTH=220 /DNA_ID=CAMNT_0038938435 /DNA_START=154 /DNA_END=816 /DNA_ORIENTATION=+
MKLSISLLLAATLSVESFVVHPTVQSSRGVSQLFSSDSPFKAPEEGDVGETDDSFEKVESFGRGAAKTKRGKRKGGGESETKKQKAAVSLAPEEVYYEGPPAITETILPTISILTVVGIVPAAAAWARQAWVRYKITSRRIRVQSGVGGNDMAEIVYSDITEIRTAKRLFGDGDMVLQLRDGAKFEVRNIPEFNEAVEFILKQCDKDVVEAYRQKQGSVN